MSLSNAAQFLEHDDEYPDLSAIHIYMYTSSFQYRNLFLANQYNVAVMISYF